MMRTLFIATLTSLTFSQIQQVSASFLIIDDFEDGDLFDGRPLAWSEIPGSGQNQVLEARDRATIHGADRW